MHDSRKCGCMYRCMLVCFVCMHVGTYVCWEDEYVDMRTGYRFLCVRCIDAHVVCVYSVIPVDAR